MSPRVQLRALLLTGLLSLLAAAQAFASESEFRVEAGELSTAVISYISQSGEEVIFRTEDLRGISTKGVSGRYSHDAALQILLQDTGFKARRDSSGAIVITRATIPTASNGSSDTLVTRVSTQDTSSASQKTVDEPSIGEVVVTGNIVGDLGLEDTSLSGSRLGLTLRETPASVEVIDASVMQARGYQELSDAINQLAGVTAGDRSSATFWGAFAMRGFERGQLTLLRDGLWLGPSTMIMRQQNTFNLERVEVLRGPSSVLNGNGAIAGAINTVNKRAEVTDRVQMNGLASYGRYDSYNAGLGVSGPISDKLYYRVDASYFSADSFVPNSNAYSTNITSSLLWQASDTLAVRLAFDYLDDDGPDYFGTVLVPTSVARDPMTSLLRSSNGYTIDRAMRFKNYNIEEGFSKADQTVTRLEVDWKPAEGFGVNNVLYHYKADRHWLNADGGVYCAAELATTFPCIGPEHQGQIQRYYGYFLLDHEQENYGNRLTINLDKPIGSREAKWAAGVEANHIDFERTSGYRIAEPLADSDSVDPYNPVPGSYGRFEMRATAPTKLKNWAAFAEGMVELIPSFKIIAATRYETMDLDRSDITLTAGPDFGNVEDAWQRKFKYWSYRLGAVYDVSENVTAYGQISNAKDPAGSNIFVARSTQNFDLTDARTWEVGLKASLFSGKGEATLAYYDIERDDVSETAFRDNLQLIGARTSKGVELSTTFTPITNFNVGVAAAYNDARILPSPNALALANKRPANVPEWTVSAYAHKRNIAGLPIDVGASARYLDDRFADHLNTTTMLAYTIVDGFVGWSLNDRVRLSAQVDNVFDEEYIAWSTPAYFNSFGVGGFLYSNELPILSRMTKESGSRSALLIQRLRYSISITRRSGLSR